MPKNLDVLFPHHWEFLHWSLDTPEPRAFSPFSDHRSHSYQEVPFPSAKVIPVQGALSLGGFPSALSLPTVRMKPANPGSTKTRHPPQSSKNVRKQGLCVVTSKRADAWHGFQLVKCHYPEHWATLSSLTPGFPPAASLLGSWHGSQPPSGHTIFCSGMAEKRLLVAPGLCMMGLVFWPHHGPLRQDWLCPISLPGELLSLGEVPRSCRVQASGG